MLSPAVLNCRESSVPACDAGIATSLKVLFSPESCSMAGEDMTHFMLERNEVIALINLLERLSHSIEIVKDMYQQLALGDRSEATRSISSSRSGIANPNFLQSLTGQLQDAL